MVILQLKRFEALHVIIILLAIKVSSIRVQDCSSNLNGHLLIAEGKNIWKIDVNGANRELVTTTSMAISMDYNNDNNSLYWSDMKMGQIYSKDNSTIAKVIIRKQGRWLPFSIALDFITDKIYVVDAYTGTLHLFDLKNNNHGIVLGTNFTELKGVALDPYEGYLFMLDNYQISRSDLDGSNYQIILSEYNDMWDNPLLTIIHSIQRVPQDTIKSVRIPLDISDIIVDFNSKRIYWVNTLKRIIESLDYDGNNRKIHYQDKNNIPQGSEFFSSLTYLNGSLYWADSDTKRIVKINASSGNDNQVIMKNATVQSIRALSCPKQMISNPCAHDNGQCQHLCVLSKSSKDNYKCACSVGYELAKDTKSCNPLKEFLLFTQNSFLKARSLETDKIAFADVLIPSKFEVGSATSLDFNAEQRHIYYSSAFPNNKLHQVRIDKGESVLLQPDFLSKDVGKFAYDWTTKNLYYFTYYYADMITLSVLNVDNATYSKILLGNVTRLVAGIVVYPEKGVLYFAQLSDHRGTISRIAMDGSNFNIVLELGWQGYLDCLAIDYQADRVYWSEGKNLKNGKWDFRIRHSNLNGEDIQDLLLPQDFDLPYSLVFQRDLMYAMTDKKLVRWNKKSKHNESIVFEEIARISESSSNLKIYSSELQIVPPNHPCTDGNNYCEKFCFVVPHSENNLKRVCDCPYGEKLAEDGISCIDNRAEEPPFIPCKYTSFKCNKQTEKN